MSKPFAINPLPAPLTVEETARKYGVDQKRVKEIRENVRHTRNGTHPQRSSEKRDRD